MSVEDDNPMSVGHVQKLNINGLCQWLKGKLNDDILDDARNAIDVNKISGEVFLDLTLETWRKDFELAYGVASSLVKLAEKVKKSGTPEGSKRVSEFFPDDFRVEKKLRCGNDDDDVESNDSPDECKIDGNDSFDVIELRNFPPMVDKNPQHKKVYVRRCYVALFDELVELIQEGRCNAMITGNPGIGKSYFYLYVIFRFIKNPLLLGTRKLVINSGQNFHILKGDVFEAIHPEKIRLDGNILRLVDGRTAQGELTGWDGSTILFASPSNSLYDKPKDLMKSYPGNYFYMAVWDDEELINANNLLTGKLKLSHEELFERLKVAGPIPRAVLSKAISVDLLGHNIKALATNDDTLRLLKYVQCKEGVEEEYYSHRLLKICPNTSSRTARSNFTLNFLSTEIANWVLNDTKEHVVAEFKRFALENNDPDSAKFRENIYEHLIHRRFKDPTLKQVSQRY